MLIKNKNKIKRYDAFTLNSAIVFECDIAALIIFHDDGVDMVCPREIASRYSSVIPLSAFPAVVHSAANHVDRPGLAMPLPSK